MRRNSTNQNSLNAFWLFVVISLYSIFSSMTYILPPLFGVCFILFVRFYNTSYSFFVALVLSLLIMDIEYHLPLGTLFGLYTLLSITIMPFITQAFSTRIIGNILSVVLFYIVFVVFMYLIGIGVPEYYMSYSYFIFIYIFIESLIVSML